MLTISGRLMGEGYQTVIANSNPHIEGFVKVVGRLSAISLKGEMMTQTSRGK